MIKVYTIPNCPYCKKVKSYFEMKNIEYENVNVSEDKEQRAEMIELSGQKSLPVTNINGEIILGFNKYAIDAALEKLNG